MSVSSITPPSKESGSSANLSLPIMGGAASVLSPASGSPSDARERERERERERQSLSTPGVRERRIADIERILNTQPVDLDALHTISRREGGFIDNELRQRIWPKFLGINRYVVSNEDFRKSSAAAPEVARKIKCDIERSFWNFSHCKAWSDDTLQARRSVLSDIITAALARNPTLQYYQGFHDIACVFIEVCGDDADLAYALIEAMSKYFLRDYMGEDFQVVTGTLPLILQMIKIVDVKLYAHLSKALNEPYFALSWLITWFAHDIKNLDVAARVFDALITSHPLFGLYMCTAVVLSCKAEVMAIECEMSQMHNFLVNVFERKEELSFDRIIAKADKLMTKLPPSKLQVLVGAELRTRISQKKVAIFEKPPCITRYCDSDAVMLLDFKREKDADVDRKAKALEHTYSSSSSGTTAASTTTFGRGADASAAAEEEDDSKEASSGSGGNALYWIGSVVVGGLVSLATYRSRTAGDA